MIEKKCTKCRKIKALSGFRLRKDNGKYRGSCLNCDATYFASNHIKNHDKRISRAKQWYQENKDIAKHRTKEWKKNNPVRMNINRENDRKRNKIRYFEDEEFRERRKESVKKWKNRNPSKIAQYRKKNNSKLFTRLSSNLRSRLRAALKGAYKSGSAVRDLGCSIQELKTYLELLWKPGMNWNNYGIGGWHIDHIIPLANFDLTKYIHVKQSCHYTNLQPLWAKDNLKKGSKTS